VSTEVVEDADRNDGAAESVAPIDVEMAAAGVADGGGDGNAVGDEGGEGRRGECAQIIGRVGGASTCRATLGSNR
jgi:hypothetical protein